jgi:hypothetical protein
VGSDVSVFLACDQGKVMADYSDGLVDIIVEALSPDAVNPSHYAEGWSNGAQVIDITEHLTSNGGQAVQYIVRSTRFDGGNKGDLVEDLRKARWFVDREIQRLEGQ